MADVPEDADQLTRLVKVIHALRAECPWDHEQTNASLVHYLIEETLEAVEAIEHGGPEELREELGDLLMQSIFQAEIASEWAGFDVQDVARGIADKLIRRHPYVFTDDAVPDDLLGSWERKKREEKGRTSALDGIPERMSALARANKVMARSRSHGLEVELPAEPIDAAELGRQVLALVSRAQVSEVDPEQAVRLALRQLEATLRAAESAPESQA